MTAAPSTGRGSGVSGTFDEVVHAPNRLQICAFLDPLDQAEFAVVRDVLGASDSVTSKHVKVLQDAGYLTVRKPTSKGRVKTWLALTPEGRSAYQGHVAALRALLG